MSKVVKSKKTSEKTSKKTSKKSSEKISSEESDDDTTNQCVVCYEKFNNSSRKPLECIFCHYIACTSCIRMYMLSSYQEPHCMKCRTAWEREFWMDKFPKKFLTDDLKKHREKILFEREKSLLPATQIIVEQIISQKKLTDEIDKLIMELNEIHKDLYVNDTTIDMQTKHDLEKKRYLKWAGVNFEIEFKRRQQNHQQTGGLSQSQKPAEERKQFVRACPADGCRGFLSTQWKCGLCNIFTCHNCHEIIGEKKDLPHTCNPDSVASAKLLAKDTRACPKCASLIFKISGCDQMFCTQCNTAFSWETNKIITNGIIHNPHYFEYLRQHPEANIQNEQCGDIPTYWQLYDHCRNLKIDKDYSDDVCNTFIRTINHNEAVEIPKYTREHDTQQLRVEYMMGELTEEKFKHTIQMWEKARFKNLELHRIIQLHVTACKDIANRLYASKSIEQFKSIWAEVQQLESYVLDLMKVIAKRYNCKTPSLIKHKWCRVKQVIDTTN